MSDFIFTLCNVENLPIVTALFPISSLKMDNIRYYIA